jgi:ferredoxin
MDELARRGIGGPSEEEREARVLPREGLDTLLRLLRERGFRLIGPTVREGAIVLDEIAGAGDLPAGITDAHAPGRYRLERRADGALFGYVVGPHSAKRFLFPPEETIFRLARGPEGWRFERTRVEPPPTAIVGLRACDLAAIAVQDRVLLGGLQADPGYGARRERLFTVAVQCAESRPTCFCASMGTGPRAEAGYDLALTELFAAGRHEFLLEVGSARGAALAALLPSREATEEDAARAAWATETATRGQTRQLNAALARTALARAPEHPRFEETARRCLACGSCTSVCPTCFCAEVEDATDLAGDASRMRLWGSCFTSSHSYMAHGLGHGSIASRYRQWITHKLSSWHDQFGTQGCTGCGRCITWCPVGIDIVEEARAVVAGRPGAGGTGGAPA